MRHRPKLTKSQHAVALLILLAGLPISLPIGIGCMVFGALHKACERLDEWASVPFLSLRHRWFVRCERINADRTLSQ